MWGFTPKQFRLNHTFLSAVVVPGHYQVWKTEDWSKQHVVSVTAAYSFPSCSIGRTDLLIFYQQKSDEFVWQLLIGKSGHNTTICSHLLEKWFWWRLWERKPGNSYQPLLFICSSGRLPKDCMAMGELHLLTTWASNLICVCCCIVIFKQEPLTERSITQNCLMLWFCYLIQIYFFFFK